MTIKRLNTFLKRYPSNQAPLFIFITGVSGVGKSFLAKALEQELDLRFVSVNYFDRIGVPSFEHMIKEYGSCEKWQEAMTHQWVKQLAFVQDKKVVILEGQFNSQFALDARMEFGVAHYVFVLLHAEREVREYRLIKQRTQPALANETMENWAQFLKRKTQELKGTIIDTSDSDILSHLNEITDLCLENLA